MRLCRRSKLEGAIWVVCRLSFVQVGRGFRRERQVGRRQPERSTCESRTCDREGASSRATPGLSLSGESACVSRHARACLEMCWRHIYICSGSRRSRIDHTVSWLGGWQLVGPPFGPPRNRNAEASALPLWLSGRVPTPHTGVGGGASGGEASRGSRYIVYLVTERSDPRRYSRTDRPTRQRYRQPS